MEHTQEYYDQKFGYYNSKISRGELESLPCPFCTDNVNDDVMQSIIMMTDLSTKQRLRLPDGKWLDFKKDKVSEVWWKELETAVKYYNIPYYEDLTETD
jgi:hypothetical protein|nr:MAG TPA: restriction alleviation protein [Caudoviricetes sp.]